MIKRDFDKKPLAYEQQLELVKSRNLIINDEQKVIDYFQQISYYRLSAYFLPYQNEKDIFNAGVTFEQILDTYSFDRALRLLIFDCIESIEVAIRRQVIYSLATKYNNAHWQDDSSLFKGPYTNHSGYEVDAFSELQNIVRKARQAKTTEIFIKHYNVNYSRPINPPSWMCIELLTIGELSRLYNGLKNNKDKQLIANFFRLPHSLFTSWLHSLTYVRNICAHHSRLWNRTFAIKPDVLLKPKYNWVSKPFENNQRTFYFLCTLQYMLKAANPTNTFSLKLIELFDKYPNVPIQFLGIPSDGNGNLLDWQSEPLWNK